MRIGIDVKTLSKRYTGIAVYVCEMIRYFNELDSTDEFFLYSNRDFELPFELKPNFHKVIYKALTGSIGVLFQLAKRLEQDHIDVFWGTEHVIPLYHQKFKKVLTVHDLAILKVPNIGTRYNAFLQKAFAIPSCKSSDVIVAISNATKNDVVELSHVDRNKVKVIYNGDSPYVFECLTSSITNEEMYKKFNIKQNSFFLFVGSIEPRKNITTIVKAFNEYKETSNTNHKLVLAGGLGWRYDNIISEIEKSPYKTDIIRTGYCSNDEKEWLYRNATALVFPSLYEGFGFPIVEAMSVGTPVITSKSSSLPEVGGDVAYYIDDVYDYQRLSKLMIQVSTLSDIEHRELSLRCVNHSKQFSRKKCAEELLLLFNNIDK